MNFNNAKFITSYGLGTQLPNDGGAEIVFCGRSNVGKSTLINKLTCRKALARVSSTPGKTTTINRYELAEGLYLMDLPGYGYAKRPHSEIQRWGELLEHYFTSGRNIRLCALLLDSRREPSADDITMLECFKAAKLPFIVVITKTDKLKKTELEDNTEKIKKITAPYRPKAVVPFTQNGEKPAALVNQAISEAIEGSQNGRW